MDKTSVLVEFKIIGDEFEPEIINKVLQISPDKYWKKGEQIKNKNSIRNFSCWSIKTGYEESIDINNQLVKIINKIKDKKNELVELKNQNKFYYKIQVVIKIENNEKPAIYLNRDIIGFLNDIKAELDFDLYIYS